MCHAVVPPVLPLHSVQTVGPPGVPASCRLGSGGAGSPCSDLKQRVLVGEPAIMMAGL